MRHRCTGNGLLTAGVIVTLIGLGIGILPALDLPRYWTTAIVGVALLLAGVARRLTTGVDATRDTGGR